MSKKQTKTSPLRMSHSVHDIRRRTREILVSEDYCQPAIPGPLRLSKQPSLPKFRTEPTLKESSAFKEQPVPSSHKHEPGYFHHESEFFNHISYEHRRRKPHPPVPHSRRPSLESEARPMLETMRWPFLGGFYAPGKEPSHWEKSLVVEVIDHRLPSLSSNVRPPLSVRKKEAFKGLRSQIYSAPIMRMGILAQKPTNPMAIKGVASRPRLPVVFKSVFEEDSDEEEQEEESTKERIKALVRKTLRFGRSCKDPSCKCCKC
jgi:hypothetical protein